MGIEDAGFTLFSWRRATELTKLRPEGRSLGRPGARAEDLAYAVGLTVRAISKATKDLIAARVAFVHTGGIDTKIRPTALGRAIEETAYLFVEWRTQR